MYLTSQDHCLFISCILSRFLDDIVVIVLNHHTTATNHYAMFFSVSVSAVYPLPLFLDVISLKVDLVFRQAEQARSVLLMDWLQIGGFMIFSLVDWFSRAAHRTQEKSLLLDYQFIIKAVNLHSRMEEMQRARLGEECGAPRLALGSLTLPKIFSPFTKPGALWTLHFRGFLQRFHYVGVID